MPGSAGQIFHVIFMAFVIIYYVLSVSYTHLMQAVSEDRDAAQLMGVNVNATISMTFAIGSGLAAIRCV